MEDDDIFNKNNITIHTKMRTGKKIMTMIYGFGIEYDTVKILKHFQKSFHCTGNILNDEKFGEVIQLTGNHKSKIVEFLTNEGIATNDTIILKGF